MKRVLPLASLEIVAQAIELEALSEDLDFAMARALGAEANELSRASYGAALLASDADRMLALFGKAGVVDDPRFDRPVALDRRQDRLSNLGQHLLVRPR